MRSALRFRCSGRLNRFYHELSYSKVGSPTEVLQYLREEGEINTSVQPGQVRIKVHFAPWNPADVNLVQGKYPSLTDKSWNQRQGRIVAGAEGVGQVVESNSSSINEGSFVVFCAPSIGTLRSELVISDDAVFSIQVDRLDFGLSCLFQLGGTALGLLKSMVDLKAGDTIVQNAGNSAVGFMVSQIAHAMGLRTVSIVRQGSRTHDQFESLKTHLLEDGKADIVESQEELLASRQAAQELKQRLIDASYGEPKFALNSVGGSSSNLLMQLLATGGTHVTYGGMSMRPVSVSTAQLIFKDIKVRGYWQTRRVSENDRQVTQAFMDELAHYYGTSAIKVPPCKVFQLSEFQTALSFIDNQSHVPVREKVIFDCRED